MDILRADTTKLSTLRRHKQMGDFQQTFQRDQGSQIQRWTSKHKQVVDKHVIAIPATITVTPKRFPETNFTRPKHALTGHKTPNED